MKPSIGYQEACDLVLSAPDTETAFDDYAALLAAYRANGFAAIDGTPREGLETRQNLGWTPFDGFCDSLVLALRTAHAHGCTIEHLADLFEIVRPSDAYQALCVVEDAAIILDRVEAPAE